MQAVPVKHPYPDHHQYVHQTVQSSESQFKAQYACNQCDYEDTHGHCTGKKLAISQTMQKYSCSNSDASEVILSDYSVKLSNIYIATFSDKNTYIYKQMRKKRKRQNVSK